MTVTADEPPHDLHGLGEPDDSNEPHERDDPQVTATIRLRPGGLTWRRSFPGQAERISEARRFVEFLLADSCQRDDAVLIVSELATNSILHTGSGQEGGSFIVEVVRTTGYVRVAVYDCGWGGTPVIPCRLPHPTARRGRGLAITTALATNIGYQGNDERGHVVWAELATPSQGEGRADPAR
jgi:serine/threonine-protein kinase RsbW